MMARRSIFTGEQDATIRSMRGAGATWDAIAKALGLRAQSVMERARRLKISTGRAARPTPASPPAAAERDRPALPASDGRTWGAIMPDHDYPAYTSTQGQQHAKSQ